MSSAATPNYPDIAHKATLLDFTDLTEHSWTISGDLANEILVDSDCSLAIARRVFRNEGSNFSLTRARAHVFEPPDCTFRVVNLGVEVELGSTTGAPFADQTEAAEDLPFEQRVSTDAEADAVELVTPAIPGIAELWESYGCANPDQLIRHLTVGP